MSDLAIAVILGLVEGITEFLPISSTGHLIIAGELLGFTGAKAATFEICIQLGAILAVLVIYARRFLGLIRPQPGVAFAGKRGIFLLFLTFLPVAVVGLCANRLIKAHLFNSLTVCIALVVGAICIFFIERRANQPTVYSLDELTPAKALGVGLFQCLALWPGFSRSAATIMGGMILGLQRKTAAEYSFVAAVPVMFAATGYELLSNMGGMGRADIPFFALGFAISFIAAFIAVKAFIGLLGRINLRPFAMYRILLAVLVYFYLVK